MRKLTLVRQDRKPSTPEELRKTAKAIDALMDDDRVRMLLARYNAGEFANSVVETDEEMMARDSEFYLREEELGVCIMMASTWTRKEFEALVRLRSPHCRPLEFSDFVQLSRTTRTAAPLTMAQRRYICNEVFRGGRGVRERVTAALSNNARSRRRRRPRLVGK